jgi:tetratricopeptide (TPR) repeat protein
MSQEPSPSWSKSPAHLFLVSNFLEPKRIEELTRLIDWELVLGEELASVIEELLLVGLLEVADRDEPLASRLGMFRVEELKEMLRDRGLPLSGRKDELIARLIDADSVGMEDAVRELSTLRCTEQGRAAVETFLLNGGSPTGEEHLSPAVNGGSLAPVPASPELQTCAGHLRRGLAYGAQSDYARAIAEFSQAIVLDQRYSLAYFWRGVAYERLGDYRRALVDFDQAIVLDGQRAEFHVGRGSAYRKMGDCQMAIAEYDTALQLDATLAIAFHNRGVAREYMGDYRLALADYQQAMNLKPESPEPHFGLGVAYENTGDVARAEAEFNAVLGLSADAGLLAAAQERLRRLQSQR